MLHNQYIAGWECATHKVCNRELLPFTLGHARFLYIAQSPFIVPDTPPPTAHDLTFAITVCSMPVPPALDDIGVLMVQAEQFSPSLNTVEMCEQFLAYYRYWINPVEPFSTDKSSGYIPWPWFNASILRRYYNYTAAAAWKELTSEAFWLTQCVAVQNGNTSYPTLDDLAVMELMHNG